GGDQDEVPSCLRRQVGGRGEHRYVGEDVPQRRRLRADEIEVAVVDDVHHVDPVGGQVVGDVGNELDGGQMPRHRQAAEGVSQDEVGDTPPESRKGAAGVVDDDLGVPGQPEIPVSDRDELAVDLQRHVAGTRTGRLQIRIEGEPAAADRGG